VERVFDEAQRKGAEAVVLQINTLGGRVDAALSIKDKILSSPLLSVAFVNKRAISAGALIALCCKKIFVAPGASIGAVEPRPFSEKAVSFIKAEMGAIAEARGRPKRVLEAMVDKDIEIEGIVEAGKLLTLSAKEAVKMKVADKEVQDLFSLLKYLGYSPSTLHRVNPTWSEKLARFFTHPLVSSLLLTLGFFGALAELRTPGIGFAAALSATCFLLFFGGHLFSGLARWGHILLFLLGAVLLCLEIFLIPGFGIAGVGGIICICASLLLCFPTLKTALYTLSLSIIAAVFLFFIFARFLPQTAVWRSIVLSEAGSASLQSEEELLGKEGVTLTVLRPTGVALIEGKRVEVCSSGEFLPKDTRICVVQVMGKRVIVEKKEV
jgi:membrane-bound serine protease (ClpP class)